MIIHNNNEQNRVSESFFLNQLNVDVTSLDSDGLEALKEILNYPFRGNDELGKPLQKYNGAVRTQILFEKRARIVRSPVRFLTIMELMSNFGPLAHGLRVKLGATWAYIHFLIEPENGDPVAVWYFDYKKTLGTNKLIQVIRLLSETGIQAGIIVTNLIALHSRDFVEREQERGLKIYLYRYDEVLKELNGNY